MRMFRAFEDFQVRQHLGSQLVLGQHAANGVFNDVFRMRRQAMFRLFRTLTGVTRKPSVFLLLPLFAGEFHLFAIEQHHTVARKDVRGVVRAMLAHQDHGEFTGESSDHLVGGVYDPPLVYNFARFVNIRLRSCHDALTLRAHAPKNRQICPAQGLYSESAYPPKTLPKVETQKLPVFVAFIKP